MGMSACACSLSPLLLWAPSPYICILALTNPADSFSKCKDLGFLSLGHPKNLQMGLWYLPTAVLWILVWIPHANTVLAGPLSSLLCYHSWGQQAYHAKDLTLVTDHICCWADWLAHPQEQAISLIIPVFLFCTQTSRISSFLASYHSRLFRLYRIVNEQLHLFSRQKPIGRWYLFEEQTTSGYWISHGPRKISCVLT